MFRGEATMKSLHSAKNSPRPRRDFILPGAIALALAVVIFFCGSTGWFLWQKTHYQAFVSTLSDSTVYAYQHNTLTGRTAEGLSSLEGETSYQLYTLLSGRQPKPRRQAPQESPLLTLDYGDGSSLEFWPVELEDNTQRQTGILWRFTSPEGKVWIYDTDRFGPNTVEKLGQS